MLTVNDVVKDYDAVMTSIEYLQKTKPFGPDHKWPTKDLTFEQDLIDLGLQPLDPYLPYFLTIDTI